MMIKRILRGTVLSFCAGPAVIAAAGGCGGLQDAMVEAVKEAAKEEIDQTIDELLDQLLDELNTLDLPPLSLAQES